jgi:hypothetical protein
MSNRILLFIFVALLALYGLSRLGSGRKERSFRTELIQLDTAAISRALITPKAGEGPQITLHKENREWIVSNGLVHAKATPAAIEGLMRALALIRAQYIAAKGKDKWTDYGVDENQATRVRVYQGEKLLEDFYVGRFNFNPQTQQGVSYVRLAGQDEVYAVDGFQVMTFNQEFHDYRNRSLSRMTAGMRVTALEWQSPDTTLRLALRGERWLLDQEGAVLDSLRMDRYLNTLRNLSGDQFADDFDEVLAQGLPQHTLRLSGEGIEPPLFIHCVRDTTRERPFVMFSSQYPENYFAVDSAGLYRQVFQTLEEIIFEE